MAGKALLAPRAVSDLVPHGAGRVINSDLMTASRSPKGTIASGASSRLMEAVFPPDRVLRLHLLRDPEFTKVRDEQDRVADISQLNRRQLLENATRLTTRMSPWLLGCVARVRPARY